MDRLLPLLYYTPNLLPGHRCLFINFLGYRPATCERGTGPSLSQGNSKVACMGGRPYGGGASYSFMCSFFLSREQQSGIAFMVGHRISGL